MSTHDLPCGVRLAVDTPTSGRLPRPVTRALLRAADRGGEGTTPCAVLEEPGAEPLAVLPLRALERIVAFRGEGPKP
jgi:hypothetical protein